MIKVYKLQREEIIMVIENYVIKTNRGRELEVEITLSTFGGTIKNYKIKQVIPKKTNYFPGQTANVKNIKGFVGQKLKYIIQDSPLSLLIFGAEAKDDREEDEYILDMDKK
jgi:hypothetical protein